MVLGVLVDYDPPIQVRGATVASIHTRTMFDCKGRGKHYLQQAYTGKQMTGELVREDTRATEWVALPSGTIHGDVVQPFCKSMEK